MQNNSANVNNRKKMEEHINKTNEILKMIATGRPAPEVYDEIALMYESKYPGLRCSLLELEDGVLLHGGAPSMPKEYCDAVHGLKFGPNVGSCGASTYTGKRVIIEDIDTHDNWADIKQFAMPHGMRSCWSEPIINSAGEVLGAFGMYYDHPASPSIEESDDLYSAARLASIVMERDQHNKKMIKNERILYEQSRHAAMGEMIGNIAHQWRQPLNTMGLLLQNLEMAYDMNTLDEEYIKRVVEKGNNLTKSMSKTIDDFRNFFKSNKRKEDFTLYKSYLSTKDIIDLTLINNDIKLTEEIDKDISILGYPNELSQVLLNIINNAKDALVENDIENREIKVKIFEHNNLKCILISDNAGGMPKNIMDKIFDPYFTTKDEGSGTGIGLYMSKLIIESNMDGKLEASNDKDGAVFKIIF